MQDAVGQEIMEGDGVVYVRARGNNSIRCSKHTIAAIEDGLVYLDTIGDKRCRKAPHRVIRYTTAMRCTL